MIKVFLDIAGFYFDIEVDVPGADPTVKDVMLAANGKSNLRGATLYYKEEVGVENVDRITIVHSGDSAVSRQKPRRPTANVRLYRDGIYSLGDDAKIVDDKFQSVDPNKHFVHAWQYYVYDNEGVDLARRRSGNVARKIVDYSETDNKGYELKDGYTVVWRLVTIMVGPNFTTLDQIPPHD